ncbi:MAG: hypothetical protein FJ207_14475 [Gemmatimonadetes bacterium]|nr:hypothetical protein [Gemmatimonadota bacterium]
MIARARIGASMALCLAVCLASACAPRAGTEGDPFAGGPPDPIFITVDNQDWRDATIFADWNGVRHRVGSVVGKTTETFSTPWREYQVRLSVDFVGGGAMRLEPTGVVPGDHLDLLIPPGW